jgi:hypothetical protein
MTLKPRLICYKLPVRSDYDESAIWSLIRDHGGLISVDQGCVSVWMAPPWAVLLELAWPELERSRGLDQY